MNSPLLAFAALDAQIALRCRALSLRQFECPTRIGVHAFERQQAQRMWFDVDLCVKLDDAPADRDDISQTVDYDFIRHSILAIVGEQHHELQETVCDAILQALLQRPDVHAARVMTRKPDVYEDSESVGTERVATKPW